MQILRSELRRHWEQISLFTRANQRFKLQSLPSRFLKLRNTAIFTFCAAQFLSAEKLRKGKLRKLKMSGIPRITLVHMIGQNTLGETIVKIVTCRTTGDRSFRPKVDSPEFVSPYESPFACRSSSFWRHDHTAQVFDQKFLPVKNSHRIHIKDKRSDR